MVTENNLYTEAGWINAAAILQDPAYFIFVNGGRGIGKTYSVIKELIENGLPFLFLRRTEIEAAMQADIDNSSLQPVLEDMGILDGDHELTVRKTAKGKLAKIFVDGSEICGCAALSTFASLRGVNMSMYKVLLYDEFITEAHVRALKDEGAAFSNCYETINRNRELKGQPPLKAILLANSLNIANDIYMHYDLIRPAEELTRTGREIYRDGLKLLIVAQQSPISKKKMDTALYKAAADSYIRMSIQNKFIYNDFTYVKKQNIQEYKALCRVGDLYIYKHKSSNRYYVTFTRASVTKEYNTGSADLERFRREKCRYYSRYLDGFVMFDTYQALALFEKYYNK